MRILQVIFLAAVVAACTSNPTSEKTTVEPVEQIIDTDRGLNSEIENKMWLLVELDENSVEIPEKDSVYFILDPVEKRVSGRLGCNSFFGTYRIEEKQKISFSKLGTTMMACPDMNTEELMKKVFKETDNFILKDDLLNLRWRRAKTLASFRLVKLQ